MKKSNKIKETGFTLVELLAVIVILAIILVIAVPKVMTVIEDAKKATLESTVKMIASAAEKAKIENSIMGNEERITCHSVSNINDNDYAQCILDFEDSKAKVSIKGKGKFEGLVVCDGTKTDVKITNEECIPAFERDDWATIVKKVKSGYYPYEVGDTRVVDLGETLGKHILRVANTTPCEGLLTSESACGFVLEFANIITKHIMNPKGEYKGTQYEYGHNVGGWPNTEMYDYVNIDIYNALPKDLRNGIIKTTVVSSYGSTAGEENFTSQDYLYLLSSMEVFGLNYKYDTSSTYEITRQLDYYVCGNNAKKRHINQATGATGANVNWWLRSASVYENNVFTYVSFSGEISSAYSRNVFGVAPAFRLAE